jgi:SAM-dependent methyltransferase
MAYNYNSIPEIGALYDIVPAYDARLDVGFYVEEAARTTGRILEIGCGTGRILLPIARAGGTITGLDSSSGMLDRLKLKLAAEPEPVRSRVTLEDDDARNFRLGGKFSLITAPFRVFQHMTTTDDQLKFLGAVARHLAPKGRFIFDVFNPHFDRMAQDRSAEMEDTPEYTLPDGRTFRRTARIPRMRWVDQVAETELIYYLRDRAGGDERRYVMSFEMRWFVKAELENLLARAGFAVTAVHGNYDRTPLVDGAPEMVWCTEAS